MCNPKWSQTSLRQQISDLSKKFYNQVPICLPELFGIYRLQMGLLHTSREQNTSLMVETMNIILMKNRTSKENRKKIWWVVLKNGKTKKPNQKRHSKEWDRNGIDVLEIQGVNVALYSVTNLCSDDQDKIYDTWYKELLSNNCCNFKGSCKCSKNFDKKWYFTFLFES